MAKIIMNEKQFVERLQILASRKTYYKNVYPDNRLYVHADGRTSGDCINLIKSVLSGYDVYNQTPGYYQKYVTNTGDCTEKGLLNQCTDVSTDFNLLGTQPLLLYMSYPNGHVGAYLGKTVNGDYNVIECTKSFGGGIVYSWVDADGTRRNKRNGTKNCKWEKHGKLTPFVDYENKTVIVPEYSKFPVLKKGSRGEYVYILQRLLVAKEYDPNGIDGIFGNGCLKAVKLFQSQNTDIYGRKLVVDGYVGQLTWGSLYKK